LEEGKVVGEVRNACRKLAENKRGRNHMGR
jgi:hypothetical protein